MRPGGARDPTCVEDWAVGIMDMREAPRREAGFFTVDEGTRMDEWGRALPRGPSEARVRRRESISEWRRFKVDVVWVDQTL
jgi:hypothetical protein